MVSIGSHRTQSAPIHSPAAIFTFGNNGSHEDIFFDSRQYLDSESEDEFLSVNGDFTPSRGSTPLHNGFTMATSKTPNGKTVVNYNSSVAVPEALPKKKLGELLQETREEEEAEKRKFTTSTTQKCQERMAAPQRQKSGRRCIPSLELCRSFSGRKKRSL